MDTTFKTNFNNICFDTNNNKIHIIGGAYFGKIYNSKHTIFNSKLIINDLCIQIIINYWYGNHFVKDIINLIMLYCDIN